MIAAIVMASAPIAVDPMLPSAGEGSRPNASSTVIEMVTAMTVAPKAATTSRWVITSCFPFFAGDTAVAAACVTVTISDAISLFSQKAAGLPVRPAQLIRRVCSSFGLDALRLITISSRSEKRTSRSASRLRAKPLSAWTRQPSSRLRSPHQFAAIPRSWRSAASSSPANNPRSRSAVLRLVVADRTKPVKQAPP